GANPAPRLEPLSRQASHVSYFIGHDTANWHADVPVWSGVRYKDIYPGMDLEVTSANADWTWRMVANGSPVTEASRVQLRIEGANQVALTSNNLVLTTEMGDRSIPLITTSGLQGTGTPTLGEDTVTRPF